MEMKNVLDMLTKLAEDGPVSEDVKRAIETTQGYDFGKSGIKTFKENFEGQDIEVESQALLGQILSQFPEDNSRDVKAWMLNAVEYDQPLTVDEYAEYRSMEENIDSPETRAPRDQFDDYTPQTENASAGGSASGAFHEDDDDGLDADGFPGDYESDDAEEYDSDHDDSVDYGGGSDFPQYDDQPGAEGSALDRIHDRVEARDSGAESDPWGLGEGYDDYEDYNDNKDEFEPAVNMCPACQGEGCDECGGEGAIHEGDDEDGYGWESDEDDLQASDLNADDPWGLGATGDSEEDSAALDRATALDKIHDRVEARNGADDDPWGIGASQELGGMSDMYEEGEEDEIAYYADDDPENIDRDHQWPGKEDADGLEECGEEEDSALNRIHGRVEARAMDDLGDDPWGIDEDAGFDHDDIDDFFNKADKGEEELEEVASPVDVKDAMKHLWQLLNSGLDPETKQAVQKAYIELKQAHGPTGEKA